MRIKNILLICLSILFVFSLIACNKITDITENNTPAISEKPIEPDEIKEENTNEIIETDELNKEEQKQKEKEECENVLKDIKVELLAISSEKYEDAKLMFYADEYDTATLLTIGIKLPKDAYNKYYSDITLCGETAIDKNDKPVYQDNWDTSWVSVDRSYALMILRVAGDIDPTKVTVTIKSKISGVTVDTKFENNGIPIGFDDAKTFFMDVDDSFGCGSFIVKLKNRHYLITRRYTSSTSWGMKDTKDCYTITKSYVLIPLEQGFKRTLTKDDVKLILNASIDNVEGYLMVNENGRIDASAIEEQTTIEVDFIRVVVEQKNSNGKYDEEVYTQIDNDIQEVASMTILEIDDGNGNIITLKMM